jgi:hypothetical protein
MFSLRGHLRADFIFAALLVAGPWVFELSKIEPARNVFLSLGLALGFYSWFRKVIPVGIHMAMDIFVGFYLMIAPYFYQYRSGISNTQTILHFVIGLGIWATVVLTQSETAAPEKKLPSEVSQLKTKDRVKKAG